ncbi:MAG: aminomethyl-transferring glycine dehydrogenase subunit GcvPB [Gammaproteobacteria bacterium]
MKLIFERSVAGRRAVAQAPQTAIACTGIPAHLLRKTPLGLPEVSELEVVRHYTLLSRKNFSIDTQFYPLGSCTMKYNPRAHRLAFLPDFANHHPLSLEKNSQGIMHCLYELQEYLKTITGMAGVSLTPMAGAQGEFAGVAVIRAYHLSRGDTERTEILVPDAAHGTNPASAVMCGYQVREVPTNKEGDVDIEALKSMIGPKTAGIMLTNPSTLGVFERRILEIAELIHGVGGLLYYDGANLNAILGKARPSDMGFDVIHMNLHKTFSTPHGGGGPGAGPIAVVERLKPFLPMPIVAQQNGKWVWLTEKNAPQSIGRLSTFMGNVGVLLRAYIYIRLLGKEGLHRVAEFATLNANYLFKRLQDIGFIAAYPKRRATHEFILTFQKAAKEWHTSAMDFAKRLLDYGIHAPTVYFPLLVPECMLIEPTETESKGQMDEFVAVMEKILAEAQSNPQLLQNAPSTLPVKRLDDVKAAKDLDLVWKEDKAS